MAQEKDSEQQSNTRRINFDQYMMGIVELVASRSTCLYRKQGAVIVRDKRIISTGYNGSPPGARHCTDIGSCTKDLYGYCLAEGLHGESNAIASAARVGVSVAGATIYCLYSPCRGCCNLIKSAGISVVKYARVYDGFVEVYKYLNELGVGVDDEWNIS